MIVAEVSKLNSKSLVVELNSVFVSIHKDNFNSPQRLQERLKVQLEIRQ